MANLALGDLCGWAKAQHDRPVMLGYRIFKINGQVANTVLLLKLPEYKRPIAEIQIESISGSSTSYSVSFELLPANADYPRPSYYRTTLPSIEQAILWIQDGQRH